MYSVTCSQPAWEELLMMVHVSGSCCDLSCPCRLCHSETMLHAGADLLFVRCHMPVKVRIGILPELLCRLYTDGTPARHGGTCRQVSLPCMGSLHNPNAADIKASTTWYSWTENFATSTSRWDTGALPHDQTPAVDAAQLESSGKCAKQGSADIA